MDVHRSAGIAVATLLMAACGSGTGTVTKSTPAAATALAPQSAVGFPTATPGPMTPPPLAISCASPIPAGAQLALVNLSGIKGFVLRDVTDVQHPVTRCSYGDHGWIGLQFVAPTRISYISETNGPPGFFEALYVVDLARNKTSLVHWWGPTDSGAVQYAWSPDGQLVTYLARTSTSVTWHLLSGASDKTLARLGDVPTRDWSSADDQEMVGFSADGQYVAVDGTFVAPRTTPIRIVHVADGQPVYGGDGTMAVWGASGARIYFRTSTGIQRWDRTGNVVTVLASTRWIHPSTSSDGNYIAFSTLNPQLNDVVSILDTRRGSIAHTSSEPRARPSFLTPTVVWSEGELSCAGATVCDPPTQNGKPYLYDITTGIESPSIEYSFFDSWPHLAGQA